MKKNGLNNLWRAYDVLKFLWKSDCAPIYIMDNHWTAAWCWMQECNTKKSTTSRIGQLLYHYLLKNFER